MSFTDDPTAEKRKKDHIELAFRSQIKQEELDSRFYYEPLLSAHPAASSAYSYDFLDKKLNYPVWVSSMTGGTQMAKTINRNLAKACGEFGMGMGLGSCRALLYNDEHLGDFQVRSLMGKEVPLYANLGVAQVAQLIQQKELYRVDELLEKLDADGLIIHVNPFQEWMQPEGDVFLEPALDTIKTFITERPAISLIVKEVGQGMGRESLKELLQLPLAAIEFAASGGTNFSMVELLRSQPAQMDAYKKLAHIGHSAEEMVHICNQLYQQLQEKVLCRQVIISGGVKDFLDGYYLMGMSDLPAIYGQASGFLKYARQDYRLLQAHVNRQMEGLKLATAFLRVKNQSGII